ncbi:uncharacterized protein [Gossypium hirsutum]|uniref:Retrotransposon gag domain-containing protein n=1 Tax=Gossypium hirsutum TaxID=3635 RepID=A0A1U8JQX0_GOSHI|nr:uncharacterized protein LOC107907931 [Gossypium hirsutum]
MFESRRDPRAHLMQYNDYMNMLGAPDAAKCKAFSTNLKGSAKDSYLSLPQGSIQSFSQLGQMFLGRFLVYRTIMSTPMGLIFVKQREGESLQDYIKRFHAATLNTKNLKDQWAIDAFIVGVLNEYVQYSFTGNRPQSLADLYKRAHKFTKVEEIKKQYFPKGL